MSARAVRPKISFVPKHGSKTQHKTPLTSVKTITTSFHDGAEQIPSRSLSASTQITPHLSNRSQSSNHKSELVKEDKISTVNHQSVILSSKTTSESSTETIVKSKSASTHCFKNLSAKQKFILKAVLITAIIVVLIAALVVPLSVVFGRRQTSQESSFTNLTAAVCSVSTCIGRETPFRSTLTTLLYMFDGNTNDLGGYAAGTLFGVSSPSFITSGYPGQCLNLAASGLQYMVIPPVSLGQQSFTIQLWCYPNVGNLSLEMGLFGQCDTYNVCLSLSIRNGRITFWFDAMNSSSIPLIGSRLLATYTWAHITVTYDATLFQQRIYVNGLIDAVSTGIVAPFRGVSFSSTAAIARSISSLGVAYFTGRIDHVVFSVGSVRSSCQIYNDANLIAYYPFDSSNTLSDYSAYVSNGISSGISVQSSGRINQAISFISTNSYFQAQGFLSMRTMNAAYTMTLWIRPSVTTSGTLVHLSTASNGGGTCYDLLVFSPTGSLILQHLTAAFAMAAIATNTVVANVWTHLALMYSWTSGLRVFINGQIVAVSSNAVSINYYDPGPPVFITLGNISPLGSATSLSCNTSSVATASGSYNGLMDDFRLYNRELDSEELCALINL